MTVQIRIHNKTENNLVLDVEVDNIDELNTLLISNNIHRDLDEMREDIKWDAISYFIDP